MSTFQIVVAAFGAGFLIGGGQASWWTERRLRREKRDEREWLIRIDSRRHAPIGSVFAPDAKLVAPEYAQKDVLVVPKANP